MDEEIEILRSYVETLNLHNKTNITKEDQKELEELLREADELTLANYIKGLKTPSELYDLIVNTLFEE